MDKIKAVCVAIVAVSLFTGFGAWAFDVFEQNDCYRMKTEKAQGYPIVPSQDELRMCADHHIDL